MPDIITTALPIGGSGLVFGCNVFGWSIHDQREANRLLDAVIDSGMTDLDTADMYVQWHPGGQGGESETLIGSWLTSSGLRDHVTIATKVGKMRARPGLSPENIAQAAEDSLRRLCTDRIDLYYAHLDDTATPLEDTLAAFQKLIDQGKVRSIGASNYTSARLLDAHRIAVENSLTPFVALQNEYNLVTRDHYETDSVPVIEQLGLQAFPYFGLASGFLTGKYRPGTDSDSVRAEQVARDYFTPANLAIVERVCDIAARHGVEPATVAIEWLRRQPGVTAPIVSARTPEQLAHLLRRVDLSDADMTTLAGDVA